MKKLFITCLVLCLVASSASAVTIGARKGLATFDNTLVRGRLQVSGNATFGGTVAGISTVTATNASITTASITNMGKSVNFGGFDITNIDDITMDDLSVDAVAVNAITVATGLTQTPVARTAGTAMTSPNAIIAAGTSMVVVTSAGANDLIILPTPVVGHKIDIICDATTAFEIRPALQTQYINATECTPNKELEAPAGSVMHATAVVAGVAGKWIITQTDDDGTTDAGGTPD